MLSSCLRRRFLEASPWIFGQNSIPKGFSELTQNPTAHSMILKHKAGFCYAFNKILDAYCKNDLDVIKDCLEGSLFSFVKEGLNELANDRIFFNRLHNDEPKVIPLDFSLISGFSIDRSKNLDAIEVQTVGLIDGQHSMIDIAKSMIGRAFLESIKHPTIKNKLYIGPTANLITIARFDLAFTGSNFIGLFKDNEELTSKYSGNTYHVFRFESEILKLERSQEFMNFLEFFIKFHTLELDDYFNKDWVLVDIDNQLGGNPIVKRK